MEKKPSPKDKHWVSIMIDCIYDHSEDEPYKYIKSLLVQNEEKALEAYADWKKDKDKLGFKYRNLKLLQRFVTVVQLYPEKNLSHSLPTYFNGAYNIDYFMTFMVEMPSGIRSYTKIIFASEEKKAITVFYKHLEELSTKAGIYKYFNIEDATIFEALLYKRITRTRILAVD